MKKIGFALILVSLALPVMAKDKLVAPAAAPTQQPAAPQQALQPRPQPQLDAQKVADAIMGLQARLDHLGVLLDAIGKAPGNRIVYEKAEAEWQKQISLATQLQQQLQAKEQQMQQQAQQLRQQDKELAELKAQVAGLKKDEVK